ncbi:MAG: YpdA family putative bacillithiol disulfide reductase [Lewinellaceae bacterium]|nr:YpdA family putative bacillithiol disulfide reductase [Phaeodactylibacter sp.]MCB9035025.1 YpdA family putative bacillithiol disulfide reductase [Lewinellaceae bacterium]
MDTHDLIIIGGGPTGLNCAIAAKKEGLRYLVLEKGVLANSIYHFPVNMTFFSTSKLLEIGDTPFISHGEKPTRREALEYYRRLQQSYSLNVHTYEAVQRMERLAGGLYRIDTEKGQYQAHSVIVATGFYDTPRLMNVPGEGLAKVKHYYDDAHPYVGQKVLVVGAANSACQVALEIWRKGAEVAMAIRDDKIYKGVKYWIKPDIENRIKEGSIKAYFQSSVLEIRPREVLLDTPEGPVAIGNDFVLAMTGYLPNYALLGNLGLEIPGEEPRIPIHNPETLETSLPNVYLAGVVCAGMETSKLFIENTRDHGELIARQVKERLVGAGTCVSG